MAEHAYSEKINILLAGIMSLVYRINSKTKFCVFFSYSGHTDQMDIRIGKDKKDWNKPASNRKTIYLSGFGSEEKVVNKLKELEKKLKEILKGYKGSGSKFKI